MLNPLSLCIPPSPRLRRQPAAGSTKELYRIFVKGPDGDIFGGNIVSRETGNTLIRTNRNFVYLVGNPDIKFSMEEITAMLNTK